MPIFCDFLFHNLIKKIGANKCQKVNLSKIDNQFIQSRTWLNLYYFVTQVEPWTSIVSRLTIFCLGKAPHFVLYFVSIPRENNEFETIMND